ncbi:MAG TPA: ATP-dependent DNA helicase RecG [Patescibacteria group bacterium]|nr:ATP-dependent DNA helicase RecG [Patescibacteria group bacterium]
MLKFDEPVSFVKGATPTVRHAWESLGIKTIGDLLLTVPRRYDDYSKRVLIKDAQPGDVVTLSGKIVKCYKLPTFRKRIQVYRATVKDESGMLSATFFNQPWVLNEFTPGREVFWSGKIVSHPRYGKTMASPIWEAPEKIAVAAGKLAPVYPLSGALTQKRYRQLVQTVLDSVEFPPETLADEIRTRLNLLQFEEAVRAVHLPKTMEEAEKGRERLALDELLTYQLAFGFAAKQSAAFGAVPIPFDENFAKRFTAGLPFPLTNDQKRAAWTMIQEMNGDFPMRRLLEGDVGSGKTVVAAFLAAQVHRAGASAALLAPTDILARQHAETFRRFLAPHHIPIVLLTRTDKRIFENGEPHVLTNSELNLAIERGNAVFIGTHALLTPSRLPNDLALAMVDEQHRFGVEQREALTVSARSDGRVPHFLSMTATPIPRSLALVLYGDLKVCTLREKPPGRQEIETRVCVGNGRDLAYEAILEAARRHEQSFIVCPLIDPSDVLGVKSATQEWKRLSSGPLKGLRIGLLHGRLKTAEKEDVMAKLAEGELDAVVSTSVIEVGVDIPRATIMAIEGAERFGMAQLHQLRGRVGRSHLVSFCFFLTDTAGEPLERLKMVARIHDGFRLAEEDLKLRGSGNLMGKEQSGMPFFRAAQLSDVHLMHAAREESEQLLSQSPDLRAFPIWRERVMRLRETSHLE